MIISMAQLRLGDGLNFIMSMIDPKTGKSIINPKTGKQSEKCLTTYGNGISIWDCVKDNPAQIWYLASDGTLRNIDQKNNTKCVQTKDDSFTLTTCSPNSTKFTYINNRLQINGTTPQRCINLRNRNYSNGAIVDSYECGKAAPDTITWKKEVFKKADIPVTIESPIAKQTVVTKEEKKAIDASVCRSTPNYLNDLFGNISNCQNLTEKQRNEQFGLMISNTQQDISDLKANIMDTMSKGDLLFGTQPHNQVMEQVIERNKELKSKKEHLSNDILQKEAIIERSNRDFSDVKDTIPEPQPKKILRFVEEYTLAVLLLSYVFFIIATIYLYTITSENLITGLLHSIGGSILLSSFLFMVLIHIS